MVFHAWAAKFPDFQIHSEIVWKYTRSQIYFFSWNTLYFAAELDSTVKITLSLIEVLYAQNVLSLRCSDFSWICTYIRDIKSRKPNSFTQRVIHYFVRYLICFLSNVKKLSLSSIIWIYIEIIYYICRTPRNNLDLETQIQ